MRFDPGAIVGPLVAALLLVAIVQQTESALRASGAWMRAGPARAPVGERRARLEHMLAERDTAALRRDPFSVVRAAAPVAARRAPRGPAHAAAAPQPVLTAIVWDQDPRATVHWNGRDYSVHVNSLFDEFRVRSITQTQVVLERGNESLVLELPRKGE